MDEDFEEHRQHLRAVAYRMLGSTAEAEDAVQEAWLRYDGADRSSIENLRAWLTTVVGRICLNVLRGRRADPVEHLPDPIVIPDVDPAVRVDEVGLALLVVLEALQPDERLAFVLHDVFALPFEEIAVMLDTTNAAARQLASRARRRVQGAAPTPDADRRVQRRVVDAFFAAARGGDLDALVAVLAPDVVHRGDRGTGRLVTVTTAARVARSAITFANPAARLVPVLVNGVAGVVAVVDDTPTALMAFTVVDGRVAAIDTINDPARLRAMDLPTSMV